MADIGHSRLLKFFVNPKMADSINETNGIASAVPGEQKIREADEQTDVVATKDDFTLSPVITVTKKEASFAKGDLKLQKVTVTEDISDVSMADGVNAEMDVTHINDRKISEAKDAVNPISSETGEEVKKVSKIPRRRFRAAVNKIRNEQRSAENARREETACDTNRRRSSIPRLKRSKTPPPKDETERKRESIHFEDLISNVTEEDFDKIFEEIVEKPSVLDTYESTIEIKDPTVVETKFDEIIHAYDSNKIEPINIDKSRSKIPLLKRKSEHDIQINKTVRKDLHRKASLGRIPISDSFADKASSLNKTRVAQSNGDNSASKIKRENTLSDQITDKDLETSDSNNIDPLVTVTKIPFSQNIYTKISSVVLNKQPIRTPVCTVETLHGDNEGKTINAGFTKPKMEEKSIIDPETSQKTLTLTHKEDSIELKDTTKHNFNGDNKDLETSDSSNIDPLVTVTKIPLSQNIYTKISSVVLNKQPIRTPVCTVETLHGDNEGKTMNAGFTEPKLEKKSIIDPETSQKTLTSIHKEESIELKATTKHNFNGDNMCDNETKVESTVLDDDENIKKINLSSENDSADYINKTTLSEGVKIKPSYIKNNYLDSGFNCSFMESPKAVLKLLEPEIEREKVSEINNNISNCKQINYPSKINEPEVVIKYKPEIKEVVWTNESTFTNKDKNQNQNVEYNKINFESNESLTGKPVKYKTISASQIVEEANEEDIIILKGKVNRVISRLDSVEPKQKKKPVDDIPKLSVKAKISIFECNDPKPAAFKNVPSKSSLVHPKDDKPRVIEGILKDRNRVDVFKELDKRKISNNLEKNVTNDRAKIANGPRDNLAHWENSISKEFPYNKDIDTKHDLEERNLKEPAAYTDNRYNKLEISAPEDDVFAKKSADIINSYKLGQQKKNINVDSDMKRAKSLAELDLGGASTEQVKKIIHRMKSIDKIEHRKEIINSRERPRKGSVSERIALFEGRVPKAEPLKMSLHEMISSAPAAQDNSGKVAELAAAAAKYGTFHNMSYVEIGGVDVPALWVGTAMVESGVTKEVIRTAIELGYRAFDTAYVYGTEKDVGEAIREKIADGTVKREELFVAGKLWSTFHRTDLVEQACRESLDKLGLDYFDLYMIHNPMSFKEGGYPIPMIANVLQYSEHDYLDAWFGIEAVVKKGLARAAGVSNFNTKQIQRILDKGKIKPVVNQVESHPYLTQLGLESFCSAHNIRLTVFGTLGSKGTPAAFKSDLPPAIDDPLVITMAAGLGITPAQLLISYQVSLGRAVVVKSSSGARLWENLQALVVPLRPEHVRALHNLNKNQRTFTFRGMGDTHKNYPFTELV